MSARPSATKSNPSLHRGRQVVEREGAAQEHERDADRLPDRPRHGQEEELLEGIGADDERAGEAQDQLVEPRRRHGDHVVERAAAAQQVEGRAAGEPPAQLDGVDPGRLERARDLDRLGQLEAAAEAVAAGWSWRAPRRVGPIRSRTRATTASGRRRRFGERAAERVAAPVGRRGEELAQEIAVPEVHLDGIEARLHRECGGVAEVVDHGSRGRPPSWRARAGARARAIGIQRGGGPRGAVPSRRRTLLKKPACAELDRGGRALGVHRVREGAQPGHARGVRQSWSPKVRPSGETAP